jgi:lipopolysaccharide/colanic/teichoic acid biosynthesis glycosyltransferase
MNSICKRIFDISLAVAGLVVSAPIMAVIAILLWLESPGKVIFSQERLGLKRRPFRMHKFRKFPAHWGDQGPGVTAACDARMTRIGAILERTKLDELPQLWNILKGEMSFVGPRPESIRFEDLFAGRYRELLEYIPGIFGPNQIAFRNECELYPPDEDPENYYRCVLFPQKAEKDITYFKRATFLRDILWIFKGLWVSIAGVINWRRFLGLHARILILDMLMIEIAWIAANFVRYSGLPGGMPLNSVTTGAWLLPPVLIIGMLLGGCYLHPVRNFSLPDAIRLSVVVSLTWTSGFLLLIGIHRNISIYLGPLFLLILMSLLVLPRIVNRIRWEKKSAIKPQSPCNIAIYGAGRWGIAMAELLDNGTQGGSLVGFIDDDLKLRGRRVCGNPVLGRESDISTVYHVHRIDELWLTFLPGEHKRGRLKRICETHDIKMVVLPEVEPFSRLVVSPFSSTPPTGMKTSGTHHQRESDLH